VLPEYLLNSKSYKDRAYDIVETDGRLELSRTDAKQVGSLSVDFVKGTLAYRLKFGGGREQAIAKAVGLKHNLNPKVLDLTAGLGRDAFVLASLGCCVHMIERCPPIAVLLEDGLKRAKIDPNIGSWVSERLSFEYNNSIEALSDLNFKPDVIYLDPIFPEKKKSSLVKKDMQLVQFLAGVDEDADKLFESAYSLNPPRIVVKRPDYADFIANVKPDTSIKTKKYRFDVYLLEKL
jgi:16S rRNA (guanine1516-N2)-methyltransferase